MSNGSAADLLREPSKKNEPSEQEIRDCAYNIWLSKGCPIDETAMDDWLEAERVLSHNTLSGSVKVL
jgi:hypothetical protein